MYMCRIRSHDCSNKPERNTLNFKINITQDFTTDVTLSVSLTKAEWLSDLSNNGIEKIFQSSKIQGQSSVYRLCVMASGLTLKTVQHCHNEIVGGWENKKVHTWVVALWAGFQGPLWKKGTRNWKQWMHAPYVYHSQSTHLSPIIPLILPPGQFHFLQTHTQHCNKEEKDHFLTFDMLDTRVSPPLWGLGFNLFPRHILFHGMAQLPEWVCREIALESAFNRMESLCHVTHMTKHAKIFFVWNSCLDKTTVHATRIGEFLR